MAQERINATICDQPVIIQLTGFRGGHFTQHFARRDPGYGPGWYVFGTNPAYNGRYTMRTAQPDVPMRRHPHYNVRVQRGWRTKREAARIAAEMNHRDADCIAMVQSLGDLHGTVFREGE
jgi:hypothetical protein